MRVEKCLGAYTQSLVFVGLGCSLIELPPISHMTRMRLHGGPCRVAAGWVYVKFPFTPRRCLLNLLFNIIIVVVSTRFSKKDGWRESIRKRLESGYLWPHTSCLLLDMASV